MLPEHLAQLLPLQRALGERVVGERLDDLERVAAALAAVLVGGHVDSSGACWHSTGSSANGYRPAPGLRAIAVLESHAMAQPAVRKAVIPAAGLGTRFLPATKAQPKEMLPVVDTPAIQYVVEEAVAAGIDDILIITGRNKRAIEDHFDRNVELELELREKGKDDELADVRRLADLADIHYVRQGEPLGLGHAVSVARKHVGDEPFVVMLGDDLMDGPTLAPLDDRRARPPRALGRGAHGGPARGDRASTAAPRRRAGHRGRPRRGSSGLVEKPAPDGGAVEPRGHGPLRVHARRSSRPSSRCSPGRGGEIQLTDAIALLLERRGRCYGLHLHRGPLRHRQQARLPQGHRRAGAAARPTSARAVPRLARRALSAADRPGVASGTASR